jgi:hypothetical protein
MTSVRTIGREHVEQFTCMRAPRSSKREVTSLYGSETGEVGVRANASKPDGTTISSGRNARSAGTTTRSRAARYAP